MKVVAVCFQIKSPINLFSFMLFKFRVAIQLQNSTCVVLKRKGYSFGKHYIMTLWRNEEDIKEFYNSNIQLIKKTIRISKEIKTLTFEAHKLPNWKETIILLKTKGENYKC